MSALLVKEAPKELHQWLKDEAQFNRRSLSQQILVCLEWCMHTYGQAQVRNPFAAVPAVQKHSAATLGYLRGNDLASRLRSIATVSDEDAREMKTAARTLRSAKARKFDYGCFA